VVRSALASVLVVAGAVIGHAAISESTLSDASLAGATQPGAQLLRRAQAAREQGEIDRAVALLERAGEVAPVIADHADLLRLRWLLHAGRIHEALALHHRWGHSESPLQADFFQLLGEAYAARGDEVAARSAWEFARLETDDSDRHASLHFSSAASYERSDELATAAESYLRIWTAHPLSAEEPRASARLDVLEKDLSVSLRDGLAHRKRGDALFRARRNGPALDAYDRALASEELSAPERRRALRQRAQTLFRLRRYPEAVKAYERLPQDTDNRIARARSLARSGRVAEGARALETIGSDTRGPGAMRAQLLAALLWEGEDEEARAHGLYESILKRSPNSSHAVAALWRLGWEAYREGRFDEAITRLGDLEKREDDVIAGLRARYWRIRAEEKAGRPGAAEEFAAIAREFPLSYYGWRARERAPETEGPEPEPAIVRNGTTALDAGDLSRAGILLEAGFKTEAREELNRLFHRARGLEDRMALAHFYAIAGEFHRSQRLMVDAYAESLARGPVPEQLELWWHAWPAPFEDEVRRATSGGGVEPGLVYAVMREESGYRPEVVSVSGARGLLQLMPETAERVSRRAGIALGSPDDLFLPRINIKLGAAYLAELLARFDGRPSAAIGSYNAGPNAVSRWLAAGAAEDDEWVEAISYDQTRGYVKRVLRSLHAYRVLY
jgi:soluble lytic murein transglycosylase